MMTLSLMAREGQRGTWARLLISNQSFLPPLRFLLLEQTLGTTEQQPTLHVPCPKA